MTDVLSKGCRESSDTKKTAAGFEKEDDFQSLTLVQRV
jgi:hypothetical protein